MAEYIPIIVGSSVAAIVTGFIVVQNWRNIVRLLKGKTIAVLGARGVGKTHLISFLSKGSIPREYIQTLAPVKFSGKKFKLEDLSLKLQDMVDVPGDQVAYGVWKEVFDNADLVFYLFRVDKVKNNETSEINRIISDAKQINLWLEEKKKDTPRVLLIGTFCDQDQEYKESSPATKGTYQDKIMKLVKIKQLVNYINPEWWILGSMEDLLSTEELVARILKALQTLKQSMR